VPNNSLNTRVVDIQDTLVFFEGFFEAAAILRQLLI
jgi:hypothetical protein